MSILKFENRTPRSLDEMYDYLVDPRKTNQSNVFGIGVNPLEPVPEMKLVQQVYKKEALTHPYTQVILSLDADNSLTDDKIKDLCLAVGQAVVEDERQVFGAIHYMGTRNVHCHYIINYVGVDGSLYNQGHHVNYYKHKINPILNRYGLNSIDVYEDPTCIEDMRT